jgi:hypothetical protein
LIESLHLRNKALVCRLTRDTRMIGFQAFAEVVPVSMCVFA